VPEKTKHKASIYKNTNGDLSILHRDGGIIYPTAGWTFVKEIEFEVEE